MNASMGFNKQIHYLDPAASLNITDQRWNEIVQQQLKDYQDSTRKTSLERLQKNKAVMEE